MLEGGAGDQGGRDSVVGHEGGLSLGGAHNHQFSAVKVSSGSRGPVKVFPIRIDQNGLDWIGLVSRIGFNRSWMDWIQRELLIFQKKTSNDAMNSLLGKSLEGSPAGEISTGHASPVGRGVKGNGADRVHLAAMGKAASLRGQTLDQLVNSGLSHSISNHPTCSTKGGLGSSQAKHSTTV